MSKKFQATTPVMLDRPAFDRTRLKAEKSIGSKVLEQLIRVQVDAGCSKRKRKSIQLRRADFFLFS